MRQIKLLVILLACYVLVSCGHSEIKSQNDSVSDNQPIRIDTSFSFMHGNDSCMLLLAKQESAGMNGVIEEKIAAWIVSKRDTLFKAKFNFNTIGKFHEPAQGQYFLELINDGGGSGYEGVLLFINHAKTQPFLDGVTDFTELTKWTFSDNGKAVLVAHGIWVAGDPDGEDFEAHYSAHQQALYLFDLTTNPRQEKEIGRTEKKYDLIDGGNTFNDIRKSEPQFDTLINWESFGFKSE
jgi:hypothetical protein